MNIVIFCTSSLLILITDWKLIKKVTKLEKILFSILLLLALIPTFFNLDNVPGPITFIELLFGAFGNFMEELP
jgi:hypothetical protein